MARTLLIRGMLVGVVAGVLAYGFASLFGESPIDKAIAFEGMHSHGGDEPEVVSRTIQSTLGLATAVLVYGAALGGIFALAFAFAYGRIGRLGARATSLLVAGVGFVAVALVPFLKYPANPPAANNAETIGRRTTLYFLMLLFSVCAAIGATLLAKSMTSRLDAWNAVLVAIAAFVVVIGIVAALLPSVAEVPADFPAAVLYQFRLASISTQLVVWTTFGVLFGALTERSLRRQASAMHPAPVG
jgi:predicted cobalt transporter CbtA